MARRRQVVVPDRDSIGEVADWYRRQLREPAVFPWAGCRWEPIRIGPTWQIDARGRWLLPERTIGWDVLGWCGVELQHAEGRPWRFTLEQARFVLWWYAIDAHGDWLFRDGVLQRMKGWGKDPLGATLCATEMIGPCRFDGWERRRPIAADQPHAWVQTAAVTLEQTKNTTRLFPSLFTDDAKAWYRLQVGKELVHGLDDERLIQAVTSNPAPLEGGRSSFVLLNETHHWRANNNGHEMADTIRRNAAKSEGGLARTLRITNAYEPSEDSVGQQDREAWEDAEAGESLTSGILYDSLEAPPDAPLNAEAAPEVVRGIRGDSTWLSAERIVAEILDTRTPPSRQRRFWYNQIAAAEDAWTVPQRFDACSRPDLGVGTDLLRSEERVAGRWVVFFDGSKSDDATGLVGCRLDDGHVVTLGMWQRPPKGRDVGWTAPRPEIDQRVETVFERFDVAAFFADPSHTRDDETQERYWDELIDSWHRRYRARLKLWAVPGKAGHSVMWDMTAPARVEVFTDAAMRTTGDIEDGRLTWDGDARLRIHVHNARRFPNRYGVSLWKGHRESKRKIDLAVCMVGARMVRRQFLLSASDEKQRSGKVW
jgi:hypothetical protein